MKSKPHLTSEKQPQKVIRYKVGDCSIFTGLQIVDDCSIFTGLQIDPSPPYSPTPSPKRSEKKAASHSSNKKPDQQEI